MEEVKDFGGSFPEESSFAASFSPPGSFPSDPETPTSPATNRKFNGECSALPAVLDEQSLDHTTPVSSESSYESRSTVAKIMVVPAEFQDIPAPNSEDTLTGRQNHIRDASEDGVHDRLANVQSNGHAEKGASASSPALVVKIEHPRLEVESTEHKSPGSADSSDSSKCRGLVDTAAPFESVKEAVSIFGATVDWKALKAMTIEKHKNIQQELEKLHEQMPNYKKQVESAENDKAQVLKELDTTKKLIEELKLRLEKAETQEFHAKQDSELAQLRAKEVAQGIADDVSVAAKAQLEVAKARHEAAVAELKSVTEELQAVQGEYGDLVTERDMAARKAEEAISASKQVEKTVEDLTLELIAAKESLESAHAAHLEAEEHRVGAALERKQDSHDWEKELKHAEEELQKLNEQFLVANDFKLRLEGATNLLSNLKSELGAYTQSRLQQEYGSIDEGKLTIQAQEAMISRTSMQEALALTKLELEEVNMHIEKTKDEVNTLRIMASSLKSELESEKEALMTIRQREGTSSVSVSSLEAELKRTETELELILTREKEKREQMVQLPESFQQAAQDADQAKSLIQCAHEELRKAKEEEEQVKTGASTMEIRLQATLKEIEAMKASEKLALAAIKALDESEHTANSGGEDSPTGVTLGVEEYYALCKKAQEAEERGSEKVIAAIEQIKEAKKSESRCLEGLDAVNREMHERKELLKAATVKAEKAKEGKLGVEQELRTWRSEHEQRRKATDASQAMANAPKSPPRSLDESGPARSFVKREPSPSIPTNSTSSPRLYASADDVVPELKPRKKKPFFPRIVMFLARKKAQSLK